MLSIRRLWLNCNAVLHQTCKILASMKQTSLRVLGCWIILSDADCATFNLFVTQISRNFSVIFFTKCLIKHYDTVHSEPTFWPTLLAKHYCLFLCHRPYRSVRRHIGVMTSWTLTPSSAHVEITLIWRMALHLPTKIF